MIAILVGHHLAGEPYVTDRATVSHVWVLTDTRTHVAPNDAVFEIGACLGIPYAHCPTSVKSTRLICLSVSTLVSEVSLPVSIMEVFF